MGCLFRPLVTEHAESRRRVSVLLGDLLGRKNSVVHAHVDLKACLDRPKTSNAVNKLFCPDASLPPRLSLRVIALRSTSKDGGEKQSHCCSHQCAGDRNAVDGWGAFASPHEAAIRNSRSPENYTKVHAGRTFRGTDFATEVFSGLDMFGSVGHDSATFDTEQRAAPSELRCLRGATLS